MDPFEYRADLTGSFHIRGPRRVDLLSPVADKRIAPHKQISTPTERFVPKMPSGRADRQGQICTPRRTSTVPASYTSRSDGIVEEDVVVGDLRGKVIQGEGHRRRPCGTGLRDRVRQPQMPQEPLNHRKVFNQREQREAPPTPGTGEHIQSEAAAHQVRPETVAPGGGAIRRAELLIRGILWARRARAGANGCPELDDEGPRRGARREDAVLCGALDYAERHGGCGPTGPAANRVRSGAFDDFHVWI